VHAAPLELRYVSVDGKGVAGAVVALRSTNLALPLARPVTATMDQQDRQFVPHVLIVPLGSKVLFPNGDSVSHQIYSFSLVKKFQLPLYRGTAHPPVAFERAGVVTLGCNIHDQMRAYVFVVAAQYFGHTDSAGTLAVPNVAPGDYTIRIWHPRARAMEALVEQDVRVGTEGTKLTLRAAQPLRLRPESQVPSNWDAY
jgi:plastocyanin